MVLFYSEILSQPRIKYSEFLLNSWHSGQNSLLSAQTFRPVSCIFSWKKFPLSSLRLIAEEMDTGIQLKSCVSLRPSRGREWYEAKHSSEGRKYIGKHKYYANITTIVQSAKHGGVNIFTATAEKDEHWFILQLLGPIRQDIPAVYSENTIC